MEKSSEFFIRSTLHDLANVLAGVRGILDLNQPGQPLSQRDRDRLEAVVEDGIATLGRCRHLVMATFPDGPLEAGSQWREALLEVLQPVGVLFRCRFEVAFGGAPEWDQWPGELLRGYVQAVTRQALPYARTGAMRIGCSADPEQWQLSWSPASALPESLSADPGLRPLDISTTWAQWAGGRLGATLTWADGTLTARLPRIPPI